jgi:hypothetical protein
MMASEREAPTSDDIVVALGVDSAAARSWRAGLSTADRGEHVMVEGDGHIGLVGWHFDHEPTVRPVGDGLGITAYKVVSARALEPLSGLRALVISEQRGLRAGARNEDYEAFMRDRWIPGVTSLPGYRAALLLKGRAGARAGQYAYLGWFSSEDAREGLLVALGDAVPARLAAYRKLIDESFARFLDPSLHRFLRLKVD